MRSNRISSLLQFLPLLFLVGTQTGGDWQTRTQGWEYQKTILTTSGEVSVHLFRLDPTKFSLDLLIASDYGTTAMTAKKFQEKSGALLVINGGFFDESFRPLGLLIKKGQAVNPLRNADWGIFQIQKGTPSIIHRRDWKGEGVTTALQVGPRLVIDGKIPTFKQETEPHRRSAIGVTPEGSILIAISEGPIPIRQWADFLKKFTRSALNLDGGGSSQLSVQEKGLTLDLPGTTAVPNVLAIFSTTLP